MSHAIIDRSSCSYYTYLSHEFACLDDAQRKYHWLITDWECYPKDEAIQKLLERDYLWMSGDELTALVEREDFQWIWGILCGFETNVTLEDVLQTPLPNAQDYDGYYQSPVSVQHPLAALEIIPTDSSYVLVVSREPEPIEAYLRRCPGAERLE